MSLTKKEIELEQIKMTWDYITNEVNVYSREYLQYFVIILTFIFATLLATVTGNCNIGVTIIVIGIAFIPILFLIYKMNSLKNKLRNSIKDLLDELDNLK